MTCRKDACSLRILALMPFFAILTACSPRPVDHTGVLIANLKSLDAKVRSQAARDLGEYNEPRVHNALLLAAKDPAPGVRAGVYRSLGDLKCRRGFAVLKAGLNESSWQLRWNAAQSLGQIGDERAVEPLIAALSDPEQNVRDMAVWALGGFRDARALGALLSLSREQVEYMREYYGSLGRIGGDRAMTRIIHDVNQYPVAEQAGEALGKIGPPAFAALVKELNGTEFDKRNKLIHCFLHGGPDAIRYLMGLAKSGSDMERRVSGLVLQWVGELYRNDPIRNEAEAVLRSALSERNLPLVAGAAMFLIREGASGSEEILSEALHRFGDREMANGFLSCGNERLASAAWQWARRHGYGTMRVPAAATTRWGEKRNGGAH